jgi:hypothetical protein
MNDTTENPQPTQRVEARATRDPTVRLFIVSGMLLVFGLWCVYEVHIVGKHEHKPFSEDINAWSSWLLNYCGPFVFIPAGLVMVIWGMLYLRRRLVADDAGIGYLGKNKIAWDDVTEVDAKKLKSKGVLYLHHGKNSTLKLDSWKLTDFRDLVALVEQKVPRERMKT